MIELVDVSKEYPQDFWNKKFLALDHVSFVVPEGKMVGFLGANGAGKSTAIKCILGLIRPGHGQIKFHPELGKNRKNIFQEIGHFPERPFFYPHLTGEEFLQYMGRLVGLKGPDLQSMILNLTERLGIAYALKRKVRGYSKGMLQRLGFACSLIHNPRFLIYDEPLSGLDPVGRKEVKDFLLELHQAGKTIFFSSHIIADIEETCTDVVVLDKGKAFYEGPIRSLVQKYETNNYEIVFTPHGLNSHSITACDKMTLHDEMKKILNANGSIYSVNPIRPTLEEIIYNVKNKENKENKENRGILS